MKKTLILIHFICLLPFFATADIPLFDVVKVQIDDSIVFIKFESRGYLKNGDFCYYNYKNEYIGEVKEVVYRILKNPSNYYFYKELHRINVKNLSDGLDYAGSILYLFKAQIIIDPVVNFDKVKILSAENGNIYGHTSSEDLCESDNEWLTRYKFVNLFDFEIDNGFCNMSLYAIEGAVSLQRKNALKELMEKLSKGNSGKLQDELHKLYKQKIIMLGFCSC